MPGKWLLQWRQSPHRSPPLSLIPGTRGVAGGQANLGVRSWTGEGTCLIHKHGPGGQSEKGRVGGRRPLHLAVGAGWSARASWLKPTPEVLGSTGPRPWGQWGRPTSSLTPEIWERRRVRRPSRGRRGPLRSNRIRRLEVFEIFLKMFQLLLAS